MPQRTTFRPYLTSRTGNAGRRGGDTHEGRARMRSACEGVNQQRGVGRAEPPVAPACYWRSCDPGAGGTRSWQLRGARSRHLLSRPARRPSTSVLRHENPQDHNGRFQPGQCGLRLNRLTRRPDDFLFPSGFFRRRPDAGGELPLNVRFTGPSSRRGVSRGPGRKPRAQRRKPCPARHQDLVGPPGFEPGTSRL
jgi:hypothetical protein